MNADPATLVSPHSSPLVLVPYAGDPLAVLGDLILDRHAATLPDLTRAVVLLPDLQTAPRLRQRLLAGAQTRGFSALLGPAITTPRHWLRHRYPAAQRLLNSAARELLLVEALREYPALLGAGDAWTLAENLLALFDELTLHDSALPRDDAQFVQRLAEAYGVPPEMTRALSNEARLVHTLWHAWRRQLADSEAIDEPGAYRAALAREEARDGVHCYLAGCDHLNRAEVAWARRQIAHQRLTLVLHGRASAADDGEYCNPDAPIAALCRALSAAAAHVSGGDDFTAFVDTVFATPADAAADAVSGSFAQRARQFVAACPHSPARSRLFVLAADDADHEARAIDLQVRRWLLDGRRAIGIVTEDRRLARRVRALLERAGVRLHDASGWALSTTSAGAALERWLEAVEEDFSHVPLLDLLKSAFVFPDRDEAWRQGTTFRLEQDIVLHENVGRGLARYRRHLRFRRARLGWTDSGVDELLDALETAAAPLAPLINRRAHAPRALLDALDVSLAALGIAQSFASDPAGAQILETLAQMRAALEGSALRMTWREFRAWLGRQLETSHFRPHTANDAVQLLGLAQSRLGRFDALILGGADREHLPRRAQESPFFNDAVRHELGITTGRDVLDRQLHHFRRLLESAPVVLITHCARRDGDAVLPSPWVQCLTAFHRLAYDLPLHDDGLGTLAHRPDTWVAVRDQPLPAPRHMPAPGVDPALLPGAISATSYQQLMNCPYQFYAAACLKLRPPETVREALQKDDYGEKVHRILQAFHGGHPRLPGPYVGAYTPADRAAAVALLEQISHAEFATNIEDNFLHRGWLMRWLDVIPAYIDWQIARARHWRVQRVEADERHTPLTVGLTLAGRIDRIDHGDAGVAVIDYKTGDVPGRDDVLSGEAVQLPFYGLLTDTMPHRAEFVKLGDDVKGAATLEGDELADVVQQNRRRLIAVWESVAAGAPLPAWGDAQVCAWCSLQGVCRRQTWTPPAEVPA